MKKILAIVFALLVMLTAVSASSDNYNIKEVKVNDISAGDSAVEVERGAQVPVEVLVRGTGNKDNVKVKAEIDGYEHGSISDSTDVFEVESGVTYKKTVYLDVPEDIDASETYTLTVRVSDKTDSVENQYDVRVKESRHDISIQDVIFRPSSSVEADSALFTSVRLENLGYKKEEDIKVTLTIPDLGVSTSDYLAELITQNQESDNKGANRDDESSGQVELFLRIPENAVTGDYEVEVEVSYERGHSIVRETKVLHVSGIGAGAVSDSTISVDSTSKQVQSGSEVAYKVMFANFNAEKAVYSAEVAGVGTFASASVDPGFVTIQPEETGELYVKLKLNDDVQSGKYPFTVKIKSGDQTVKELNLEANVQGASTGNLKSTLQIGFAILAIILVVLGLIIAFRKLREDEGDEELEEPSAGQTYY